MMSRPAALACAVIGAAWLAAPAGAAQTKQPPACAAISFRGLPAGLTDGEQDAGLYKSRFGRIIVHGSVKGGQVQTYSVTVNNKPPGPAGTLPASVAECAAAKHLPAPGKPSATCIGERLTVLVDHSGNQRFILLYARQGRTWQLCSAGAA